MRLFLCPHGVRKRPQMKRKHCEDNKMNLDIVDAKLLDAHSALREMQAQERKAVDPNRVFERNHTAFLAACDTLRDQFHQRSDRTRNAAIKAWKDGWEEQLKTTGDRALYDFMHDDRNNALHKGQSVRTAKTKELQIGNHYQDDGCTISGTGGMIGDGRPQRAPLVVKKPHYVYEIAGVEQDVTKVCAAYWALLQRMVTDFRAAKL
jgi:hypothetical protein